MPTINSCDFSPVEHALQVGGTNGKLVNIPPSPSPGFVLTSNGSFANPTFSPLSNLPTGITTVSSSPYFVLTTDYFLSVITASSMIIRLPNTPTTGTVYIVKDKTGNAETNPITVTTVSGLILIDGSTSYLIKNCYQANQFIFDGTNWEVF